MFGNNFDILTIAGAKCVSVYEAFAAGFCLKAAKGGFRSIFATATGARGSLWFPAAHRSTSVTQHKGVYPFQLLMFVCFNSAPEIAQDLPIVLHSAI